MARRVILDTQYTFTPASRTITIPRNLPRERLLLITNVTTNKVIYNFSDSTLTATAYSLAQPTNATNAITTIVLAYNTTSMSSTDKLQIVVDEPAELFSPDEAYLDPVGKFRVSTPQALIDTDFEYGLQPTKWETLTLLNNRPSFFVNTQTPFTITDIQVTTASATVTVSTTTPPAVGTPILIQDSLFAGCNGAFLVETVSAGTSFTFTARYPFTGTSGSVYNSSLTLAFTGSFYSGSAYNIASQPVVGSSGLITITTTGSHGLQVGDGIYIANTTASTGNNISTSYNVASVTNSTVFTVIATNSPTSGATITNGVVYPRPDGVYLHRAFDGGVTFNTGTPAHNIQTIRQTRRFFRYQSGKGIQISTGTILKPNINIDSLDAVGSVITVTTKIGHALQTGVTVNITGANETAYNGTFVVTSVIDAFRFTYSALATPSATPATGLPILAVTSWYGSSTRIGMFDSQNGIFFEFDGQTLWAVRRKSTDQLAGGATVTNNSTTVTGVTYNGTTSKFAKQLVPGDYIVIRGMSYRVLDITSDTSMQISPAYRGTSVASPAYVTISKTVDIRVPQSQFNMDTMDGNGPSGINLDLSKAQMFYMDYSWYGSGPIRYGFRDTQGKIFYCHRFVNNNQNFEAWMRSGNLPARYETNTIAPRTTMTTNALSTDTTLVVANTYGFPSNGTILIANPASYEYVAYTGTTGTSFTGLTRAKAGTTVAAVTTVSGSATVSTASSLVNIQPGMLVTNANLPNNTYVQSINTGAGTILLSQAATASSSGLTLTFTAMSLAANSHTVTNTAPIAVYSHVPQFSPTISHWGTSVIMDGQFDNDKSLQFTYGETTTTTAIAGNVASIATTINSSNLSIVNTTPIFPGMLITGTNIPAGTLVSSITTGNPNNTITMSAAATASGTTTVQYNASVALASLRVSPSVDSGITGTLGQKELINRMQLTLAGLDVITNGNFLVQLYLNGIPTSPVVTVTSYSGTAPNLSSYSRIATGTSSLAQVADHIGPCYVTGGEIMYSFYAVNSAGSTNYSVTSADLTKIRDLGNSIMGGGTSNGPGLAGTYPDGPDVLTIVATNIGTANAAVQTRVSWTEAQA